MQPIHGDPDFVQAQASAILHAAGQMGDASRRLYSLADGGAESDAVTSMEANVQQLAGVLADSVKRYGYTGDALSAYAPALRSAIQRTTHASDVMNHLNPGAARRSADEANLHYAVVNQNPFASQHDKDQARLQADHASAQSDREQADADRARHEYDAAVADLNAAAQVAIGEIELGIEMSHLNDSFWDHVESVIDHVHSALSQVLAFIDEVLSDLSKALSLVALGFLAVGLAVSALGAPEIGVFILGIGEALGKAATVVSLVDLGVQLLRFTIGDIQLGELVVDGIAAAAAVVLFPVGGKALSDLALKSVAKGVTQKISEKLLSGAAEFDIGESLDRFVKDPLSRFLDENFLPPLGISTLTSHDVDQLTPNFTSVNVDDILRDSAVAHPVLVNPGQVRVYAANVA